MRESGTILRFIVITISGLLFVASTSAWNSLGYINPFAWALEWGDVTLAFICLYISTRLREPERLSTIYILIPLSLIFSLLSIFPVFSSFLLNAFGFLYFLAYAIPVIILAILLLATFMNVGNQKILSAALFATVLACIMSVTFIFTLSSARFPTDESVFDLYSLHLFLSGLDPYNPLLASQAMGFYNFQLNAYSPITPLTTGGIVSTITYPALSFLIFLPAVLFNIKSSYVIFPLFAVPMLLVWYRGWSRKAWVPSSMVLLPFLSLSIYTYQGASANTDILWASLLMLSYYVLPRQKLSGFLFGLSLAVKQFPIVVAPFLLYFVLKEYGRKKAIQWTLLSLTAFLIVNGYFIFLNPGYFVNSMIENEFAPLIGIGYGPAQLSFLGILQIPRSFFTIIMMAVFLTSFVFYAYRYDKVKSTLFIFPVIIFLFNYRLFAQYLYYWMILSLLPLLDLVIMGKRTPIETVQSSKRNPNYLIGSKKMAIVLVALIFVGAGIAVYHESVQKDPGIFVINSIQYTSFNSTGYVDSMEVNITYIGGTSNETPVLFRIIPPGPVVNANMLLWKAVGNQYIISGHTEILRIVPEYEQFAVNGSGSFMIVAYYGNIQGSFYQP